MTFNIGFELEFPGSVVKRGLFRKVAGTLVSSLETKHGNFILLLTFTHHHACIPRRVRQKCTNVHPQFAGMIRSHVPTTHIRYK